MIDGRLHLEAQVVRRVGLSGEESVNYWAETVGKGCVISRPAASVLSKPFLTIFELLPTCDSVKRSLILSFGIADTMAVEAGFCEAAYSEQTQMSCLTHFT